MNKSEFTCAYFYSVFLMNLEAGLQCDAILMDISMYKFNWLIEYIISLKTNHSKLKQ